jgi:hypothetical protein
LALLLAGGQEGGDLLELFGGDGLFGPLAVLVELADSG